MHVALCEGLSCNFRRRTDEVYWSCRLRNKSGRHSAAKHRTAQVYVEEWQTLGREAEDSSGLYRGVADTRPRSRGELGFIKRSGRQSAAKHRTAQVYTEEWQTLGREAEDSSGLYRGVADTRPRSRGELGFI